MDNIKLKCLCLPYVKGRIKESPYSGYTKPAKYLLKLISTDITGPFLIVGHEGSYY